MSTASQVPETRPLHGDDARRVLSSTGWPRLLTDAFRRMRAADGFSHARSLAFLISFVTVQALIGLVGLSRLLGPGGVSQVVVSTIRSVVPGPAGLVLTTAVAQAGRASGEHRYSVVILCLLAGILTATAAMGQVERGLNRIYGIEQDRSSLRKYGLALVFALSAGVLVMAAFTCMALGRDLFKGTRVGEFATVWLFLRWPLGIGMLAAAVTVIFRWSPRRNQPTMSWLALATCVTVLLWGAVTAGLAAFFANSSSFGATYGPLAGVMALLTWSLLSSMSLFYGAAVAAQLEAVRADAAAPKDPEKVADSEPIGDRALIGSSAQ